MMALGRVGELGTQELRHGLGPTLGHLLGKEGHTDPGTPDNGPLIGLSHTGKYLQECGLALTVPPHEPNSLASLDAEIDPIQEGPLPKNHSKVLTVDQRHEGLFRAGTA